MNYTLFLPVFGHSDQVCTTMELWIIGLNFQNGSHQNSKMSLFLQMGMFLTFSLISQEVIDIKMLIPMKIKVKNRGHPELNQGPLDLQSNALPLSYIPTVYHLFIITFQVKNRFLVQYTAL